MGALPFASSILRAQKTDSDLDEVEIPRIRKFGHKNTLADESTSRSGTADPLTVAKRSVGNPSSLGFFFRVNKYLIQSL